MATIFKTEALKSAFLASLASLSPAAQSAAKTVWNLMLLKAKAEMALQVIALTQKKAMSLLATTQRKAKLASVAANKTSLKDTAASPQKVTSGYNDPALDSLKTTLSSFSSVDNSKQVMNTNLVARSEAINAEYDSKIADLTASQASLTAMELPTEPSA